jgi:hypothetical protein
MRTANAKTGLLRPLASLPLLAVLFCLAALAAPLAAEAPEDDVLLRVTPAQPYDNDSVTLHYQVFTSPCINEGVSRNGNNFDLVFGPCPILPPGPTVINIDVELSSLAPGTYQMRYLFGTTLIEAHTFTVREALGTCRPDATVLCLGDRRFRVESTWQANGQSGAGQAAAITRDTGRFSFFQASNVEVVVKVIDACALDGHFWVFAAGLTNVRTVLTVTDTTTSATRTYQKPNGPPFAPIQDTAAFPCS